MKAALGYLAAIGISLVAGRAVTRHSPEPLSDDRWHYVAPHTITVITRTGPDLAEASALATGGTDPAVFWTLQDSGNPPEVMAIDSGGALRAIVTLHDATNVDWEALSVGRCAAGHCLYIVDTGDNRESRDEVVVYRITEPTLGPDPERLSATAERLRLSYPDHPHDTEAMFALPGGDLILVTKGRSGHVLRFRLDAAAWDQPQPARLTLVDTLPITPQVGQGRAVTDAAISPDLRRVAIRTYREIYLFDRDPDTGSLSPHDWTACDILGQEPQGEGITWAANPWQFVLLSEKGLFAGGTLTRVDCAP